MAKRGNNGRAEKLAETRERRGTLEVFLIIITSINYK